MKDYLFKKFRCKKCKRDFTTSLFRILNGELKTKCRFCETPILIKSRKCKNCNRLINPVTNFRTYCSKDCKLSYYTTQRRWEKYGQHGKN